MDEIEQLLRDLVTVVSERIYPQGDWHTGEYGIAEVTIQNASDYELRNVELRFDMPGQVVSTAKFEFFETTFDDLWHWSSIKPRQEVKAYFWLKPIPAEDPPRPFPVEIRVNHVAFLMATVVVPLDEVRNDYAGSFDQITLI